VNRNPIKARVYIRLYMRRLRASRRRDGLCTECGVALRGCRQGRTGWRITKCARHRRHADRRNAAWEKRRRRLLAA
jgi:tRNA(Ile2) C34 agmatinyltransferase TiaS